MKSSLLRSVFFGFMSWGLPLALTFIATPIVVHALGAEEYGLYALVLGFVSYSFTFSVGRAVTKYVSEYLATGQEEKIREILSATLWLNVFVGAGGALVLCLLAQVLVVNLFDIKPEMQEKAVVGFYLAAATIFLVMLAQVFSAVLQAVHRFDVFSYITTVTSALVAIGNIVIVLLGGGSSELLAWNLTTTALSCVLFYFTGRKLLPHFNLRLFPQRETLWLVGKFTAGVMSYQISGNLLLLFERGWITQRLGTESLTFYVVPMLLAFYIHYFISSLSLGLFPTISELAAQNNQSRLRSVYERATKYICLLVAFLGVTLVMTSRQFLGLWLGAEFAEKSTWILSFHVVTYSLMAILIIAWQLIEGYGLPFYNSLLSILFLIAGIFLMIALTARFGNEGVAAARLISVLPIPFFIWLVEKRVLGKILWRFWGEVFIKLAVAIGLCALAEYLALHYLPGGWLTLILTVAAGGAVYLAAILIVGYLNEEEKNWWLNLVKRVVPALSASQQAS